MMVIKAHFDGKRITLPAGIHRAPAGGVLVIFDGLFLKQMDELGWLSVQQATFAKAWDNDEDAIYDSL